MQLLPGQFQETRASPMKQHGNIVDYVAGMTDGYAMEMYRNFMGIEIKRHGGLEARLKHKLIFEIKRWNLKY